MTPVRRAAYLERIVIHGHVTPEIAAQALTISEHSAEELRIALSNVVEPRARRRLIDQAASLLAARLSALVHPQARRLAS